MSDAFGLLTPTHPTQNYHCMVWLLTGDVLSHRRTRGKADKNDVTVTVQWAKASDKQIVIGMNNLTRFG
jgi:hypothetical protein